MTDPLVLAILALIVVPTAIFVLALVVHILLSERS